MFQGARYEFKGFSDVPYYLHLKTQPPVFKNSTSSTVEVLPGISFRSAQIDQNVIFDLLLKAAVGHDR